MGEEAVRVMDPAAAELAAENERLQQALRARVDEEAALRRVATLIARQHEPEAVLAQVTEEVACHLDADTGATVRYDSAASATIVANWAAPGVPPFNLGRQFEITPDTSLWMVHETRAPARVDCYEGVSGVVGDVMRARGVRAAISAPIFVDGELWGGFTVGSTQRPFPAGAEARIGAFAELVAQAIANVDARIKLQQSRARIVEAADAARRRIERDLHDGAQQRLVGLALSLRLAARAAEPATATALQGCIEDLHAALADLRELARGLHPVVLTERGLVPALQMLAGRSPVPVVLEVSGPERRLPAVQEAALYFVAAEALTNVAKYAHASAAQVTLRGDERWAEVAVADDGAGGARAEDGSGLRGLGDRVEALGGRLNVESVAGQGTTVRARVPIAAEPPAGLM